jgi:predicted nucleotidyltransferase component of viral defense system
MNEAALKERLHTIAKQQGITFNECWKQFLLERFLVRLAQSKFTQNLIFKGGLLLSYLIDIGRETVDLDFVLKNLDTEVNKLKQTFESIATSKNDDGFIFHCEKVEELTHLHMSYPGYRITIATQFGTLKDKIHVDIGVGDVVEPEVLAIDLLRYREKPIFEDEIKLMVYPVETIFAEKLETVISRGAINSRMKDYHDLFLLTKHPELIERDKLHRTIAATFTHRGTILALRITFDEQGMANLQGLWIRHLRGLGDIVDTLALPENIADVISEINLFLA